MTDGDDPLHARQLPRRDYLALKAATRALIEMLGGVTAASAVSRIDAGRLSRYGNPHEALFAPLDVIADLEAAAGDAAITRALAALAGFHLVERAAARSEVEHLTRIFGVVAAEMGDVLRSTGEALVDGRLTAQELATIDREAAEAEAALAQLRTDIAARRGPTARARTG